MKTLSLSKCSLTPATSPLTHAYAHVTVKFRLFYLHHTNVDVSFSFTAKGRLSILMVLSLILHSITGRNGKKPNAPGWRPTEELYVLSWAYVYENFRVPCSNLVFTINRRSEVARLRMRSHQTSSTSSVLVLIPLSLRPWTRPRIRIAIHVSASNSKQSMIFGWLLTLIPHLKDE